MQFASDLTFLVFADLNALLCVALYASLFPFAIAIANAEVIAIVSAFAIVAFAFAFAAIPVAVAVAFSFYQIQFACAVYLVLLPPLDAKDHTQAHHL